MDTILVTGGCGFIGSAFLRSLYPHRDENTRIINLDLLSYAGNIDNLPGFDSKLKDYIFIQGDIRDELLLKRIWSKYEPNMVFHFAAETHVTRSEKDPNLFWSVNVIGTQNLLNRFKRSGGLFIHISTDEIYGPAPRRKYFKETEGLLGATSPYAKSKAAGDAIAQEYLEKTSGLYILRPTNNFGPYQHPEKFLPRSIISGLSNNTIKVWGNGRQIRDWLYVEDTVDAINSIVTYGGPEGVYNIGACHQPEITNLKIASFIANFLSEPDLVQLVDDPRPDHDQRYAINTDKIKQTTGWLPRQKPPWGAMEETIYWYKDNQKWWRKTYIESEKLYTSVKVRDTSQ